MNEAKLDGSVGLSEAIMVPKSKYRFDIPSDTEYKGELNADCNLISTPSTI